MNKSQTQFLELLRAGLWGVAVDPDNFRSDSTDWKAVLRIAKEQTMLAVVTDGIEMLPKELWPPKEVMMKLAMMRLKTEQAHTLLNSTIAKIVGALEVEGVHSVLLKGQGIAQNYRRPESRTCGDIDLYTGLGGYQRAYEIIEALHEGRPHKEAAECTHHLHTDLNGVEVEIHRQASFIHGKRMDANFQEWTRESMDALFGFNIAKYPAYQAMGRDAAHHILYTVVNSAGMNGFVHGVEFVNGFAYYKLILIGWDVLATAGMIWMAIRIVKKRRAPRIEEPTNTTA